ncbi:hypothetical protein GGD38_001395 [Chitinophagaceae bacterium OAS944]|nr:hypothetical protein [Chitinophagaceae bacterium OAS944]
MKNTLGPAICDLEFPRALKRGAAKVIQNGYAFKAGNRLCTFSQGIDYQFEAKYAFFLPFGRRAGIQLLAFC